MFEAIVKRHDDKQHNLKKNPKIVSPKSQVVTTQLSKQNS